MPEFTPNNVQANPPPKRKVSVGEAQIRTASWIKMYLGLLGIKMHDYEEEALQVVCGAFVRKFPRLQTLKKRATDK